MVKIVIIALLCSNVIFSQSAKDFIINDNNKIFKSLLTDIISESKNYGYNLERDKNQEYVFKSDFDNFIVLSKEIDDSYSEGLPKYSVGNIYKKYYFTQQSISNAIPWKIETVIRLTPYENVDIAQIKNSFNILLNNINKNLKINNYVTIKKTEKLNHKSFIGQYYDLCYESVIQKPCLDSEKNNNGECTSAKIYLNGESFEVKKASDETNLNFYSMTFLFMDKGIFEMVGKAETIVTSTSDAINNIRFTIGNQDMRKINQYDLKLMIKYFLDDCKKNNLKIPEIKIIEATFEPLNSETLALSFAYGDDSLIKIKVDPEKWINSTLEKKWYVLYHELGHDVLNLDHGQGGKMMFNFADKEYNWDEFFKDKEYMFNYINEK